MQVQEAAPITPARPPGPLKTALKPPKRRLRQQSGSSTEHNTESTPESPREGPG